MIRDENTQGTTQQNAQPEQTTQRTQQTQQSTQTTQFGGIGNVNSQFERSGKVTGGDARSSEALQLFNRLKEQSVAQQDLVDDFSILRFDRDQNQVGWSSIVIAKLTSLGGEPVIAVRPLIMPNAGIELPARKVVIQNGMQPETLEVEIGVTDVFTPNYFKRLVAFVQGTLGKPNARVVLAGAFPIPADLVLKDSELQLQQLLVKSVNACDDILAHYSGEKPFNVNILKGNDETLTAKTDIRQQPIHDSLGNPIRADLLVGLQRVKRQGQAQQENEFYEADVKLNQVAMFTNLEYQQQTQPQSMFGQVQQTQPVAPCVASVVITDVRNADWIKASTPEMYWLSLTNAFRSTHNHAWARPFLPLTGVAKDLKDIGALGYLTALQAKIDTKAASFDDAQFGQLMLQMVQQRPVFQIDLNRLGEQGVMDGLQLDAAGGTNQQKATAAIIRQINNLGGGGFEKYFDHTSQAILTKTGQVIDLGYFHDADGERRDRRELDNLAALNASEGNINEWWSYYSSQQNPHVHADQRARLSRNYDRQYLGAVTYTGKAERCTYNPKFIEALDAYIAAAGLQVSMDNTSVLNSGQRFTGNGLIGQFMVGGQANVQHFQVGGGNGFAPAFQGQGVSTFY